MANNRPLNAAQIMQKFGDVPPLEQQIVQAAEDEIKSILSKRGCMIVFEQVLHNGLPVGGTFLIRRKPDAAKPIATAVPHPADADLNS